MSSPLTPLSVNTLPSVEFEGRYYVLGCLAAKPMCGLPEFEAANQVLPESEWREIDLSHYGVPILDQAMTSSCVGHAADSAVEIAWAQAGKPLKRFSPYFIYGNINGGRDQGAIISDAMESLLADGVAPLETMPRGVMYRNQFPTAAVMAAKRFRATKAWVCRTWEAICTSITLGRPTPLGILVGQNFPNLDSDGVAPLPNGGGGGHAILGLGLRRHPRRGWQIKIQNSWSARFGMGGFCYITRNHFQYMMIDAFSLVATMDDPMDDTPVDEVPVATNG